MHSGTADVGLRGSLEDASGMTYGNCHSSSAYPDAPLMSGGGIDG